MNKWLSMKPEQLIIEWRNHRSNVENMDLMMALSEIVEFWKDCPRKSRMIDYYTPETWPGPWEILYDQLLCDSAVSLMMYYTLKLTRQDCQIRLYLIDADEEYVALVIDDSMLLNYFTGEIADFNTESKKFNGLSEIDLSLIPDIK